MKDRYIMGKNCVREALRARPTSFRQVYILDHLVAETLSLELKEKGIPLKIASKQQLAKLVSSESHQGYVAVTAPPNFVDYREFLHKEGRSVVVMVDSIYDPQNLGAILRAAECFGADLLIFSKNRGTGLTPVVAKASAGGSELLPIAAVSNLVETMVAFQKAGYWSIAAEVREGAKSLYDFEVPEKTVLILGSEGKGIQSLLSKKSDFHLYIPMKGKIDSLNVSQAAAVFLTVLCGGKR